MSVGRCKIVTTRKGRQMPRYQVEMMIEFAGEIEADNEEHAEQLAWTSWGETYDSPIVYDGVYSIEVEAVEEDEDEEDEDEEDE
jgi:hypothetical protein